MIFVIIFTLTSMTIVLTWAHTRYAQNIFGLLNGNKFNKSQCSVKVNSENKQQYGCNVGGK